MGYQISPTDPSWDCNEFSLEIARAVAQFAKTNGITTQSGWTTFVASISTLAQVVAICKGLLGTVKCSAP